MLRYYLYIYSTIIIDNAEQLIYNKVQDKKTKTELNHDKFITNKWEKKHIQSKYNNAQYVCICVFLILFSWVAPHINIAFRIIMYYY